MKFKYILAASAAAASLACGIATPAFAQSTGSVDFENEITVVGTALRGVSGVDVPDTSKAKQVLNQTLISRQAPGQTVNDIINLIPGVSFQNNDPFGSAGGKLTIRGFDNTRISQTFDGLPLNDTGSYALYSNQQLDPELIEQVNVNLGSTDVDSPTAAASGSTVNYRTRLPYEDFSARMVGSVGGFDFMRVFGSIDTGALNSSGLRAFIAASSATNKAVYGNIGRIDKKQVNARLYQPIGDDGDFVSIAAHYNQNRNNFFASVPLRLDSSRVVGSSSSNRFPITKDERFFEVARCVVPAGVNGVADAASSCGSAWEYRFNPSNTGNIRLSSRFTLADGLVLTVDPSVQYTKANGGGTITASEGLTTASGFSGFTGFFDNLSGTKYFFNRDLNGDGDKLDTVRLLGPSQTQTWRLGVISSLRYDIDENNVVRIAYSWDRGRHRQTGEIGYLAVDGFGADYFPVDNPVLDANGNAIQKRNRLSYAILHQISGEYRGQFLDDALTVTAGLRAPFFKRNLTNYCFTTSASGSLACSAAPTGDSAFATAYPTAAAPQQRIFNYNKVLPNVGLTFDVAPSASIFANYSQGLQVPGTDNLYQSFFYAIGNPQANPQPESTNNFDLGLRLRSGRIMAQVTGWWTIYNNRLASAYDRDLDQTVYRNLGRVNKYGIDGSIAYTPIDELSFYVFGSYLKSKIQNDVVVGEDGNGNPVYALTAGKRESGAPVYTFGARAQGDIGPVSVGVQAKRTGPRYLNDQNLPVVIGGTQVYGAKTPAYTLVDLDAKLSLEPFGLGDKTFLQLNVSNLFDELYVGGFDGGSTSTTSVPNAAIGAPRTFIATVSFGF